MAGVRSSKTVNGTVYNFDTLSGQVMRQTWGGNTLEFIYDEVGTPYAMLYTPENGTTQLYYYVTNALGDVVGLMNSSASIVAEYRYDPWGKLISTTGDTTLAELNPLRYKGYYYDTETGFYYLQTRYYDPEIGRFINADSFTTTDINGLLSTNMFAYCENNPISRFDPTGEVFWDILDLYFAAESIALFLSYPTAGTLVYALVDVAALLPVIPSTGYFRKAGAVFEVGGDAHRIASTLRYAEKYGIDTYRNLSRTLKGTGLEAHHIIEKRFASKLKTNVSDMLSVALTKEEHQLFTNSWRKLIPYITKPKANKVRRVDIGDDIIKLLRLWRREQSAVCLSEYVFNKSGEADVMHPQTPTRYFQKFAKRYGVPDFHPHKLRHTSASIAITNGADVVSVSKRLGHADPATTLRLYSHANEETMRRAGDVVRQAVKQA